MNEQEAASKLVERIISGDKSAEQEMVERYHRGLMVALVNRSRDKYLAEEVAQDTWLVVIGNIRENKLRESSKLAAYIIQTGKNQLIMRYRKHSREDARINEEQAELEDHGLSPMQVVENQQLGKAITKVFSSLRNDRDRQLLIRYYQAGDKKSDLCSEFGLSLAHFDRVMYRARNRFKEIWGKQ